MTPYWNFVLQNWRAFVMPAMIFLVVLAAGWTARRIVFRGLRRFAERSSARFDDVLVAALHGPFLLWVLMLGLFLAVQSSQLPQRAADLSGQTLRILWIASLTFVAAKLAGELVKLYGEATSSVLPVTTLTQGLAAALAGLVGLLVLLDTLAISITPILTALGVGGIAVALALQDTLSNLFAGFYVSLAGQVRPGDYLKLDSGEEGYVTDITWRSTTLRALANNLIVVPNSKLAQAIVTNYHLPEKRMSLLINVGVSYGADPGHVERVLIEEATEGAQHIPGLLAEPAPFVRFIPGFGASSIDFTLICQVQEFVDQYLAQHELRKRIFSRFRKEGIEIPFPIRTVRLQHDAATK